MAYQSVADRENQLRVKLTRLIYRHGEMKIAYHSLKCQVKIGLIEVEEVFSSLAIPLMKLVGLKTVEMAKEGRFSTIIVDSDLPSAPVGNYAIEATMIGREIIEKQQSQLIQLIKLLKQIESQVNSRHDDLVQTLAKHRISLKEFFQKAISGLSHLHSQNRDTFSFTVKLLRALSDHIGLVFGSVETGVDDLMQGLSDHMCNPMVEYVKCLKADMKMGACVRLMAIVNEMDMTIRSGRLELEEARKRVTREGRGKSIFHHKFLGAMKVDQDRDDTLLWELLKKKRKYQAPESPMGPGKLQNFEHKTKCHKPTKEARQPLIPYSPAARSCPLGGLLGPQTPCKDTRIPLGLSPSAAKQLFERIPLGSSPSAAIP